MTRGTPWFIVLATPLTWGVGKVRLVHLASVRLTAGKLRPIKVHLLYASGQTQFGIKCLCVVRLYLQQGVYDGCHSHSHY